MIDPNERTAEVVDRLARKLLVAAAEGADLRTTILDLGQHCIAEMRRRDPNADRTAILAVTEEYILAALRRPSTIRLATP
jgi:hypothetical protein